MIQRDSAPDRDLDKRPLGIRADGMAAEAAEAGVILSGRANETADHRCPSLLADTDCPFWSCVSVCVCV
jgi:hypothetical protein